MDNLSGTYDSIDKILRDYWAKLMIVRGFISRLVKWVSVTQQDPKEAGVYLRQTRELKPR